MNPFRISMLVLVMFGMTVVLSSMSYADDTNDQVKIKSLNEAAVALQQSNPDLAAGLTKFANEEATEIKGKEDEKEAGEKGEAKEENEAAEKTERAGHIKLLRDSASALKSTNPDLSLTLMQIADKSEKKMNDKKMEEKNEKKDEKGDK